MPSENQSNEDDDGFSDLTMDPADPEPKFADLDNQTEEEVLRYVAWIKRNIEALGRRGLDCLTDD